MRDQGVFADNVEGLDFATQNEMFYSGKAAMMHGGAWSYAELPEELQDVVVLGGLPLIQGAPYDMPTAWAGFTAKGVHITRNGTEKLDAIEAFVKFLYQPENIARFVEDAGMVPPISGVDVDQSKLNPLFVKSLDLPKTTTFVLLAETKIPASIDPPWSDLAADTYIPGGMSAQEILKELDAIYTDYLE